jgi:hypothetical protein
MSPFQRIKLKFGLSRNIYNTANSQSQNLLAKSNTFSGSLGITELDDETGLRIFLFRISLANILRGTATRDFKSKVLSSNCLSYTVKNLA